MTRTLVICNHRSVGRIVAHEGGIAVCPAAASRDTLLHRSRRDESGFLPHKIGSQRAQRRNVVDDPNAAAMGCENEIVFTGLNRKIAHGDRRKMIAFELRPAFSAVDRDPKPKLRAKEKEI